MSFDKALAAIDDWPVPSVAAAVVSVNGVQATRGPVDAPFPLASVTKPLAALSMLVAVEEGALELTAPADDALIPGATLRHLLAHASGLAFDTPTRSFPPAHRRVYSNVGIELAAERVAEAVELPFERYFAEALSPLQLGATSLDGSPASGGVSSVADLGRVVHELLAPTGLLHPTTLADVASVQYPGLRGVLPGFGGQDPNDWGLGFEIRGEKSPHWTGSRNSPSTYGHFGQAGTFFWIDPAVELGLVVLTDRDFGDWARELWPALSDAVLATA